MSPHQQIRTWISEEIAALRAHGATDVDMREEAFVSLVSKKILEHHWDEIHAVPELSKAMIAQRLRTASPATLRQQAAISHEVGTLGDCCTNNDQKGAVAGASSRKTRAVDD
jgi:hypothetical protein